MRAVINSIGWLNDVSASYNQSGNQLENGLPPTAADPHALKDDPTDPGHPDDAPTVAGDADTTLSVTAPGDKGKAKGKR